MDYTSVFTEEWYMYLIAFSVLAGAVGGIFFDDNLSGWIDRFKRKKNK